ncbi:MAG: glycosyltransferase family A protein [Bacteroidaceae bacterium]|jgi:glycosyltransferase involved in cell wall biosynthesis|nr:glycosyltransferase family A protein [Bacteroidaceae bacterium]
MNKNQSIIKTPTTFGNTAEHISSDPPLVSVLCPTYNQAPFIKQCLDSVLTQQTTFRYEILINDDCSTDGTTKIVKEYAHKYPDLIRLFLHDQNQFTQGVDIIRDILLPEAEGKYIAICEGDDYWINANKLQHEADLMEQEPETGLVYTYFYKYSEQKQERTDFHFHEHEGNVYDYILASKCTIWYLTVMMRKSLMLTAPHLDTKKYFTGDIFWYYWVTLHAQTRLLREFTGVYRLLDTSVSHFMDRRKKIDFFYKSSNTRLYFVKNYPPRSKPTFACLIAKKSLVNCFKYALAHGDYALCQTLNIPLFPLMSLKKTFYWILRICSFSELSFLKISELYNRYLNKN